MRQDDRPRLPGEPRLGSEDPEDGPIGTCGLPHSAGTLRTMATALSYSPIRKPDGVRRGAVLDDYAAAYRDFSWTAARAELSGLPGGAGLNIAHEAVDRHASGTRADVVALRWLDRRDGVRDITYCELADLTSRFANLLSQLGVRPGERVFTLLGRVPELYVAVLGTLKTRAVLSPSSRRSGPNRCVNGCASARASCW